MNLGGNTVLRPIGVALGGSIGLGLPFLVAGAYEALCRIPYSPRHTDSATVAAIALGGVGTVLGHKNTAEISLSLT